MATDEHSAAADGRGPRRPRIDWVTVNAGRHAIGRTDSGSPLSRVDVPAFRVAPTPVTNADYLLFVDATGHPPPPFMNDPALNAPEQPVVGVNWFEANAYLGWLSALIDVPCRLPTEAEREVAARGGLEGCDWPWGSVAPEDRPECQDVALATQPHVPKPGCFNALGLACMADNVHEWCSDWYSPEASSSSEAASLRGPATGARRASRGGSWRHRVKFTAVWARSSLPPEYRYSDYGFRAFGDA